MSLTHIVRAELNGLGLPMVDITADVDQTAGISWVWGRTDPLASEPSAGMLTFQLDNRTGDYTPGNPTGTYALGCAEGVAVAWWVGDPTSADPGAKKGRMLIFRMGAPSLTFPSDRAGSSVVVVTALDVLAQLANRTMRSMFDETVLHLGPAAPIFPAPPTAYWPLTETTGATAGQDVSGNGAPSLVQGPNVQTANMQWAQGGGVPVEHAGALYMISGTQGATTTPFATGQWNLNYLATAMDLTCIPTGTGDSTSYTIVLWVTAPRPNTMTGGGYHALFEIQMADGWACGMVLDRSTGALWVTNSLQGDLIWGTGASLLDGSTHQVSLNVSRNSAGGLSYTCMVDNNNPQAFGMSGRANSMRPVRLTIGAGPKATNPNNCMDWTGAIHHVSLWPLNPGAAAMQSMAAFGRISNGVTSDTASTRTAKLMSWLDPGSSNNSVQVLSVNAASLDYRLDVQNTAGQSMLEMLGDAQRAEGAMFWAASILNAPVAGSPVGALEQLTSVYQYQWTNKTPITIVDVESQAADVPPLAGNMTGRVSSATAEGPTGSVKYTDPTLLSVTKATASVSAATSDVATLARLAQARVAATRDPALQVTSISVDLYTSAPPPVSPWLARVCATLPGDRLRVTNLPVGVLGRTTSDHYVVGGNETYTRVDAVVEWVLQAADAPPPAQIPTAGQTDNLGRFTGDTACYIGAGTQQANETDIYVHHDVGAAWSTSAADYPLLLKVGAECIYCPIVPIVSNSTLQIFQGVTRGYNGTKARVLNSVDPVDLWLAPTFAL